MQNHCINSRFVKKFKKFINISQLLLFSNNMEYDPEAIEPIQGAFYSTTSKGDAAFNYFREEHDLDINSLLAKEDDEIDVTGLGLAEELKKVSKKMIVLNEK